MKSFFAIIFIIVLSTGLYAATLKGVRGNVGPEKIKNNLDQNGRVFELSPERGRYAHVYTLATTGDYSLSREWAEAVYPDVGWHKEKFYSFFAPGISYMAAPFYNLGEKYNLGQLFSFAFISLASILALIFLYLVARQIVKLPVWASVFSVILFAFGTTSWSYAVTLYQHHLTALFILSSVYAVWKFKQRGRLSFLWAIVPWACYGLGIFIDYPNTVLLLPVLVYLAVVSFQILKEQDGYRVKFRVAAALMAIFFVGIMGLHFYHNNYYFGSPTRLSSGIVGYKEIKEQDLEGSPDSDKLIVEAQAKKQVTAFLSEQRTPRSFAILMGSTDRGLFYFMPIMILAVFGVWKAFRKNLTLEHGILLSLILANIFVYSSWGDPWGGWAYGPRYLIPAMSILSIYVAYFISKGKLKWLKKIFAFLLFAFSSAVAIVGVLTTSAIPPKVEAVHIGDKFNFLKSWDYLNNNTSSSFVFNEYFKANYTLFEYAIGLYSIVLVTVLIVLFIIPLFNKNKKVTEVNS